MEYRSHLDFERLALLVPELTGGGPHDARTYALAYVERYQGDVLQLAQEWEFLYDALTQAWQRAEYAVVVRLVAALAHAVGRIPNWTLAEGILRWGIAAARHTSDRQQLAGFLNRLSGLQFAHGHYRAGRQTWRSSLDLSAAGTPTLTLWEPFATFAYMADVLGDYPAAQHFAAVMQTERDGDPDSCAVALFIRGFYARVNNDPAAAYRDLGDCLRRLAQPSGGATPALYRQLFTNVAQAELARVQGDYPRSQGYTSTAVALAQLCSDRYTLVDLLIDQALFTAQQERLADTQALLRQLGEVAQAGSDPQLVARYRALNHRLTPRLPAGTGRGAGNRPAALHDPLSARELEVLQLIAAGHAGSAIAERLVITPATVKKHLEHIYSKLDVHSRTAAVAQARALNLF